MFLIITFAIHIYTGSESPFLWSTIREKNSCVKIARERNKHF